MSKYREVVLSILSKDEIMSTNEVLTKVEAKAKKTVNWHNLYRILLELSEENKVEKLKAKAGFFWKRK